MAYYALNASAFYAVGLSASAQEPHCTYCANDLAYDGYLLPSVLYDVVHGIPVAVCDSACFRRLWLAWLPFPYTSGSRLARMIRRFKLAYKAFCW